MRRRNHALSSFPSKQNAKSVKFDGYVSRATRDAVLDFVPEGAPSWKYYPNIDVVSNYNSARQVKISENPLNRVFDSVIEQTNRTES